jgi:hypothetical protein
MEKRAVRTFSETTDMVPRIAIDISTPVNAVMIWLVWRGRKPKREIRFFPIRIPTLSPKYARIALTTRSVIMSLQFISDHIWACTALPPFHRAYLSMYLRITRNGGSHKGLPPFSAKLHTIYSREQHDHKLYFLGWI